MVILISYSSVNPATTDRRLFGDDNVSRSASTGLALWMLYFSSVEAKQSVIPARF